MLLSSLKGSAGSYELANLDVYMCTFNLFIEVTFIMKLECDWKGSFIYMLFMKYCIIESVKIITCTL